MIFPHSEVSVVNDAANSLAIGMESMSSMVLKVFALFPIGWVDLDFKNVRFRLWRSGLESVTWVYHSLISI